MNHATPTLDTPPNGTGRPRTTPTQAQMDAAALKAAAATTYAESVVAGEPLSGTQLGDMYGRSSRWGRLVIAASAVVAAAEGTNGNGNHPDAPEDVRQPDIPVEEPAAAAAAPERQPDVTDDRPADAGLNERQPEEESTAARFVNTAITVIVALVAAAASYGHMLEVALMAGESMWVAQVLPITVDGLAVAALRQGEKGRWWLALAIVVSIAANIAAAEPTLIGRLVAAWPPVALLGTHRLLHRKH